MKKMKRVHFDNDVELYQSELVNLNNIYDLIKIGLAEKISIISDKITETEDLDLKGELCMEVDTKDDLNKVKEILG